MAITTSQYNTSHLAIVNTDIFTCGSVGYDTSLSGTSRSYTKTGNTSDGFAKIGQAICLHGSRLYVIENDQIKIFSEGSGSHIGIIATSDQSTTNGVFRSIACGHGRIVAGQLISNGSANIVYVFDYLGGNEIKLPKSNGGGNRYGVEVSIGCGRIVVSDVDNNQAYVHDLQGREIKRLTPHDTLPSNALYGNAAVGSGRIVVGAGTVTFPYATDGAVYVYDLHGTFLFKLSSPSGGGEGFGREVSVGDGRIVVGAPEYSGTYTDDGKVYVYDLNGNPLFNLDPPNADSTGQLFGVSLAVGCGKIMIGAQTYGSGDAGRAFVYNLDGDLLITFTGNSGDFLGASLAISNTQSGTMYAIASPKTASTTASVGWYFMDDLNQVHYLDQLNDR